MKTETPPETSIPSDDEENPKDAKVQTTIRRMAYKTVLVAVVIGILTVSTLSLCVTRQEENPATAIPTEESDAQVHEGSIAEVLPAIKTDSGVESINHKLSSMSGRIDRGFKMQQTHSLTVKRELTAVTEGLQTIKVVIADLEESNRELGRRIGEASTRMGVLAKAVQTLNVTRRKPTIKRKPRPVKTPPFLIDAIDVWDDVTYVAVSQAGRMAFLKDGEQRSGWTVTHIDRLKGQVDFHGPAGQTYSVSVPR